VTVQVVLDHDVTGPPDAPVLVLAGSLGTDREMWRPQLAELCQRWRVLRFDHRGHGGSPVPPGPYTIGDLGRDVLRLLDRLGHARVAYCGLSLGGMVGMWLAATAPERVERLVVMCTSAYLPPPELWRERAAGARGAGVASIADAALARWFTPEFARREPAALARARAMLESIPGEGYAGCCEAIAAMDQRPRLPRITAPTLVVAGAEDPATPPEHGQVIADAVPDARLVVLPGVAHFAGVERPGPVNELLLGHLAGPGRPAGPAQPAGPARQVGPPRQAGPAQLAGPGIG
jgi:3-oxoadipate enol-lactonase